MVTKPRAQRLRDVARQARTNLYRQHVIEAAEAVFAEQGFESAKVQEIARQAGLSMGTLYAVFPSKEELYRAILDQRGGELLDLARDVVDRGRPAAETLVTLMEAYVHYLCAHPQFLRMHLRAGTAWAVGPSPGMDSRHWREIHALQTEIFRRGIGEGVFVDEDPAYLAKVFTALDQVLLADWVAGGMVQSPAALARRFRRFLERTFWRCPPREPEPAAGAPAPTSSPPD